VIYICVEVSVERKGEVDFGGCFSESLADLGRREVQDS
jgi:hypothetical protein